MSRQILVIETPGTYLRLDQNRIAIESPTSGRSNRALDDVGMILIHTQQATLTAGLMAALSEVNASVVICNDRHEPASIMLPLAGHAQTPQVLRAQIDLSIPRKKRFWAELVRSKIINQSYNLRNNPTKSGMLRKIAGNVQTGDRTNCEATAARLYWANFFEDIAPDFQRGSDHPLNALLNYGYAVVRSAIARSTIATGLHPTLGVFHSSRENSFALCDDLIEPFRPLVDSWVKQISIDFGCVPSMGLDVKRRLVAIMASRIKPADGDEISFLHAIERLCQSFKRGTEAPRARLMPPEKCEFLDTD